MNQIFRITENEVYIDSLIIESTWNCAKNCQGCYLKAHKQKGKQLLLTSLGLWELLSGFLNIHNKSYSVNQISISVNEPTKEEDIKTIETILACIKYVDGWNSRKNTKIHLTLHNPTTIKKYKPLTTEWFALADSIYFSNISEEEIGIIQDLRALNKNIEIGWNCRLGTSERLDESAEGIISSIYYIVDKSKRAEDPAIVFSAPRKDIKHIRDICYIDYNNWKKDWHNTTCSANISKFTVWPDGSVSGCPYIKQSDTGPATTWKGILANITESSKFCDFNKCPMKEIYK
jgi:hypothetical protein